MTSICIVVTGGEVCCVGVWPCDGRGGGSNYTSRITCSIHVFLMFGRSSISFYTVFVLFKLYHTSFHKLFILNIVSNFLQLLPIEPLEPFEFLNSYDVGRYTT